MDNIKLKIKGFKRYLYFSNLHTNPHHKVGRDTVSERQFRSWWDNDVRNVFFLLKDKSELKFFNYLDRVYTKHGFTVDFIYLDDYSPDLFPYIEDTCKGIMDSLKFRNSLLVSFDNEGILETFLSLFLVHTKNTPEDAIGFIESVNGFKFPVRENEDKIVGFRDYLVECEESRVPDKKAEIKYIHGKSEKSKVESEEKKLQKTGDEEVSAKRMSSYNVKDTGDSSKIFSFMNSFRFPIRSKLISIVSLIIILSMTVMIVLATFFFKTDNEIRLQETSLRISDVLARKAVTDLSDIVEKVSIVTYMNTREGLSREQKRAINTAVFKNQADIIFISLVENMNSGKSPVVRFTLFNDSLKGRVFSKNEINSLISNEIVNIGNSLRAGIFIRNVSDQVSHPVVFIGVPLGGKNRAAVAGYRLDGLIKTFSTRGITDSFVVNSKGDVLVHTDSKIILAGENFSELEIVKRMIKSPVNNGYTRFMNDGKNYFGSFKKTGFAGLGVISTVPEDIALAEVYNIQRRNIYIMIIVLNVAVFIVFFFAKSITKPIFRLRRATEQIENGDYDISIESSSNDEIGDLTRSFVHMGRGLQEREKMKDAFGRFVNKEIADMVLKDEIKLGGERKDAVVMFTDIRSFTAISEKLPPEKVVEFLNEYFTEMVLCVHETGGVVDKYIGDAIMAVWGTPVSTGNDIENAVDSALSMRKRLVQFNKKRGDEDNPVIRMGCGINSGPVIAGQIGSLDRMEYTIIGDTVNLASRIEALNKPFGTDILITSGMRESVEDVYDIVLMQKIMVKGKESTQEIYAVLGRKDDANRPQTLDELQNMLGTKAERRRRNTGFGEVKYEIIG